LTLKAWKICLAQTETLKPHEQSLPYFVAKLREEIKKDKCVIHPVIVDAATGLVVDGTHRVEAALKLRIPRIPVYTVDYFSEKVELHGWGRAVTKKITMETLTSLIKSFGFSFENISSQPYAVKFLWSDGVSKQIYVEDSDIPATYSKINLLEKQLQQLGIKYVRDKDLEQLVLTAEYPFGYMIRQLTKKEVLESVLDDYRLPPKSTRHVVEDRPMFIFCPVDILYSDDADERFAEWLDEGTWIDVPPGVELDRKYDEKTKVFFREELRSRYPTTLMDYFKAASEQKIR